MARRDLNKELCITMLASMPNIEWRRNILGWGSMSIPEVKEIFSSIDRKNHRERPLMVELDGKAVLSIGEAGNRRVL